MIPFFSTSFLFPSSVSGPLQGQSKGGPCSKKEFFSGHHTDAKGEEQCLKGVDVLCSVSVSEAEYPQRDRVAS